MGTEGIRTAYAPESDRSDKRESPFVTSVPLRCRGAAVLPEPNFPARPDEFVGRKPQVEAFEQVLVQGLLTGRTPSFAVLGDWGVGKSSLLLKYSAISSEPDYAMLPVFFSVSTELSDYKHFAEGLLDTFTRALESSDSLTTRFRNELQKWKLKRLSVGAVSLDRQGPEFYLSSGPAILKHALHDEVIRAMHHVRNEMKSCLMRSLSECLRRKKGLEFHSLTTGTPMTEDGIAWAEALRFEIKVASFPSCPGLASTAGQRPRPPEDLPLSISGDLSNE
jgi:hypothetical protein